MDSSMARKLFRGCPLVFSLLVVVLMRLPGTSAFSTTVGPPLQCGTTNANGSGAGNFTLPRPCSNTYCINQNCAYKLCTQPGRTLVQVNFTDFQVEHIFGTSDCYDYLIIDGAMLCGATLPPSRYVPADADGCITIIFRSDNFVGQRGFSLNFQGVTSSTQLPCASSPCQNGGTCINSSPTTFACTCTILAYGSMCQNSYCGPLTHYVNASGIGGFTLPTCPNATTYCANLWCTFNLCANNTNVSVTVNWISIESHPSCSYDYLTIGGTRYCGTTAPAIKYINATSNGCAQVIFWSDADVQLIGFRLTFAAVQTTTTTTATTTSTSTTVPTTTTSTSTTAPTTTTSTSTTAPTTTTSTSTTVPTTTTSMSTTAPTTTTTTSTTAPTTTTSMSTTVTATTTSTSTTAPTTTVTPTTPPTTTTSMSTTAPTTTASMSTTAPTTTTITPTTAPPTTTTTTVAPTQPPSTTVTSTPATSTITTTTPTTTTAAVNPPQPTDPPSTPPTTGGSWTWDPCSDNPCSNGGTCTLAFPATSCLCASGWTGTLCETPLSTTTPGTSAGAVTTTTPTASTTSPPGTQGDSGAQRAFFQTTGGYAVIGVLCGVGALALIGLGYHLVSRSARSNKIRHGDVPSTSRTRIMEVEDVDDFSSPENNIHHRRGMPPVASHYR